MRIVRIVWDLSDTDDTNPPRGETSTIQTPPTMTGGGCLDADYGYVSHCRQENTKIKTKVVKNKAKAAAKSSAKPAAASARPKSAQPKSAQSQRQSRSQPRRVCSSGGCRALCARARDRSTRTSTTGTSRTHDLFRAGPVQYAIPGSPLRRCASPLTGPTASIPTTGRCSKYTLAEHLKGKTPRFSMELRYRDGLGQLALGSPGRHRAAPAGRPRPFRMVGAAGDIIRGPASR